MDKFDVQTEIQFKKRVIEIKATEKILPHEKYKNASIPASSSAFSSKFILFLFARFARKQIEKFFLKGLLFCLHSGI